MHRCMVCLASVDPKLGHCGTFSLEVINITFSQVVVAELKARKTYFPALIHSQGLLGHLMELGCD